MSFYTPTMRRYRRLAPSLLMMGLMFATAPGLLSQQRVLLPEGTVISVSTESVLSSARAREGDTFRTTVIDSVRVEGFTAIPEGSTIDGTVNVVRQASDRASGVLGVEFTGLQLPTGSRVPIEGKLTSTDPSERRQIDAQAGAQVLFVGGRTGPGAAIGAVSAGNASDPVAGMLGALGTLLSKGAEVTVPAGTRLAVQLERGITINVAGESLPRGPDAFTIYTSTESIGAAQRALAHRGYYRGPQDGTLSEPTQRALVEFQIDNGIIATGNLDGRTAAALGLRLAPRATGLTPDEATLVRRNAQVLSVRYRDFLGITQAGRLDPRRFYNPSEIELYFALSAFADNASVYEQMTRLSGNVDGLAAAAGALLEAARRVDAALGATRAPSRTASAWSMIKQDLAELDATYGGH